MSEKKAVVAGHLCLDILPSMGHLPAGQFEELFRPGHLISVGKSVFATGGAVSNVGLTLHSLGIPTRLIASIGSDPYGPIVRNMIHQYGPDLLAGITTDDGDVTSFSVIISPPGVDRIFLHCPGVNDLFQEDNIDFEIVADADLFHFGYPPLMRQMYEAEGAHLITIFRQAKASGVTTSLDMAFPDPSSDAGKADWRKIIESVMPYVDIFMPGVEETLLMLRPDTFHKLVEQHNDVLDALTPELLTDLAGELINMGARIVVLKLGHRGIYTRTTNSATLKVMGRSSPANLDAWADQELWSACFKVNVIGTTGAGDATNAGFLSGLLRDMPLRETINTAVAIGACNVEAPDALSGLLSWTETTARIRHDWHKHPLDIQSPRWHWDAAHALWFRDTQ